jgi:hypothetical protein
MAMAKFVKRGANFLTFEGLYANKDNSNINILRCLVLSGVLQTMKFQKTFLSKSFPHDVNLGFMGGTLS